MLVDLNTSKYKNPDDFVLINKLRENDPEAIADIFEYANSKYKERYRICMMRAKGLKAEKADPPKEWLAELKFKMMENNWGENLYNVTEDGKKEKKKQCWGSLRNFKPEETSFDDWFFGKGKWYEETSDCVVFRFFLMKAVMEKDTWATCYIFNLNNTLHNAIPGRSDMEEEGKKSENWRPPTCYFTPFFRRIIKGMLEKRVTYRTFEDVSSSWGNDFWAFLYGINDKDKEIGDTEWAELKKYDPTYGFKTWLFWKAIKCFEVSYYPPRHLVIMADDEILENIVSDANSRKINEEKYQKAKEWFDAQVDNADHKIKTIIAGKNAEKKSKEIAEELNTTENAVNKKFQNWKDKLNPPNIDLYD